MNKYVHVAGLRLVMAAAIGAAQTTNVTNSNNGTTNTVPVYTGSATLGNSPISVSGSNVGIGTTTAPAYPLEVDGSITSDVGTSGSFIETLSYGNIPTLWIAGVGSTNPNAQAWFRVNPGTYWAIGADYNNSSNFEIAGPSLALGTNTRLAITTSGNVGIGTTGPGAKLEVNGNLKLTSGSGASITFADGTTQSTAFTGVICGGDYAESVDVVGDRTNYATGDVLVIDPSNPSKFLKSAEPYSTAVAGIFSTKPGTVGRRQTTPKNSDEIPMAIVGIVPAKVSAENGPIRPSDLLVSSATTGYAMKGTDRGRMLGAVVGKAMGSLDSGTGVIEVLVTLQ